MFDIYLYLTFFGQHGNRSVHTFRWKIYICVKICVLYVCASASASTSSMCANIGMTSDWWSRKNYPRFWKNTLIFLFLIWENSILSPTEFWKSLEKVDLKTNRNHVTMPLGICWLIYRNASFSFLQALVHSSAPGGREGGREGERGRRESVKSGGIIQTRSWRQYDIYPK